MRRRDFLKLVAASGAGAVVFTGCDLSTIGDGSPKREFEIQSPIDNPQDFAWGRDLWYATAFSGVSGGSGLIVRVYEGRAKKVDGNPDYPLNMGRSSPLEQSLVQELYHPDRIGGPLALNGSKGSGNYKAMAWNDAMTQLDSMVGAASGSVLADHTAGFRFVSERYRSDGQSAQWSARGLRARRARGAARGNEKGLWFASISNN